MKYKIWHYKLILNISNRKCLQNWLLHFTFQFFSSSANISRIFEQIEYCFPIVKSAARANGRTCFWSVGRCTLFYSIQLAITMHVCVANQFLIITAYILHTMFLFRKNLVLTKMKEECYRNNFNSLLQSIE